MGNDRRPRRRRQQRRQERWWLRWSRKTRLDRTIRLQQLRTRDSCCRVRQTTAGWCPVPPRSTCLQHCGVITFTLGRADPVSAQNPHRCTSSRILPLFTPTTLLSNAGRMERLPVKFCLVLSWLHSSHPDDSWIILFLSVLFYVALGASLCTSVWTQQWA